MTKQEMIIEAIESLGYKPEIDDDGDIRVRYQMKIIYFIVGKEDEQYVSAVYPQFEDISDGEDTLTLATCNKVSRDIKFVKVFIDHTLKSVSACCEFFYTDMECMKINVEHSLNILGVIRSVYYKAKDELSE